MPHFTSRIFKKKIPVLAVMILLLAGISAASKTGILMTEEQRFDKFAEEVFSSELSGNTISLHYTVADPASCNLENYKITLGNPGLESRKQARTAAENYLSALHHFSYDKLSEKKKYTYDVFEDYLKTELEAGDFLLYDEPLSPTLGIQAQLPVLLAEYPFRTKKDIEDYLTLLTQLPDYFQSLLSYENTKSSNGLFMSDECALEVISQCRDFIADPESNYLLEIFQDRIDEITNLTTDEKIGYKNRNREILLSYVIPAYQKLIDGLTSMYGTGTNSMGLYYYPNGTSYYEYLVKSKVGDDRPIETIEESVKKQMVQDYSAIQELIKSRGIAGTSQSSDSAQNEDNPEQTSGSMETLAPAVSGSILQQASQIIEDQAGASSDPEAILNELRQKITNDFPLLPSVTCEIKYVHDSLQEYLSPAFYLTPAIDDFENNVIYINPSNHYSGLELFTTLAHEGYPGHLYQSVYYNNTSPDLLRNLLGPNGYTEGWATYVEMYAYNLWEEDPRLARISQRNRSFMLGLASLLDIGIHYHGYSRTDTAAFLEKLGFDSSTSDSLYRSILEAPANYLQYYVGYLNFCELRDDTEELMGETFTLKKYHTLVLEAGPMPFSILRTYIKEHASAG